MLSYIQTSRRLYSSIPNAKPLLLDILPSKKMISRLLFDYDARYNFNKYLPVIESIYDNECSDYANIPEKFKGNDLLVFQRVLAQIRKQTHTINPLLLKLENDLIEKAAERGSRDALSTLSFMALEGKGEGWSEEDKTTAKSYIKELMELEHPLTFKLAADRELKGYTDSLERKCTESNDTPNDDLIPTFDLSFSTITESPKQLGRAISLYEHFLSLDSRSTIAAAAHRSLGMIYFRTQQLGKSKEHFEKAVELAPSTDNPQAHFFLGLLNETDPLVARYHFQMAASEGFRESFANLGYLELNVFNDLYKSREWFALGAELGVPECIVGLFDVAMRKKDYRKARAIVEKAERQGVSNLLKEVRKDSVELAISEADRIIEVAEEPQARQQSNPRRKSTRWDL